MSTEVQALPTRDDIEALQRSMVDLQQAELETRHHFAGGMYCREMYVPADCTIVGKVHKSEHFFMLLKGEMTLICEGFRQRVSAPFVSISKPGMKRAGYSHTECVCVNVHNVGDIANVELAEALLVEHDPTARFDAFNCVKRGALEKVA